MEKIKIGEYDIILEELGPAQGKIIIASPYLNTSYYWGSMGSSLKEFICSIDSYYWLNKLLPHNTPKQVNVKKTFAAFRKHLFGEALYCYPWYKYKEFHKTLREEINSLQSDSESEYSFIDNISSLPRRLSYMDAGDYYERERVENIIMEACSEPWYFIVEGESREQKQLIYIHKELKKRLKKHPLKTLQAA